jgi:hypothetical protein
LQITQELRERVLIARITRELRENYVNVLLIARIAN